jgi:hypothetical protein
MSKLDWGWLLGRLSEVQAMGAEAAAEVLERGVSAIDERLGVEVTDVSGTRQVVVTAGGDAEAFDAARRVVAAAPSIPGWEFVALRPGQGFDFEVTAGELVFDAKELSFQALSSDEAPTQLAIRLLVPNPWLEEWAELGLRLLEDGLGEEAAALIGYIEIDRRQPDSEKVFPLESLPGWIQRHTGTAN